MLCGILLAHQNLHVRVTLSFLESASWIRSSHGRALLKKFCSMKVQRKAVLPEKCEAEIGHVIFTSILACGRMKLACWRYFDGRGLNSRGPHSEFVLFPLQLRYTTCRCCVNVSSLTPNNRSWVLNGPASYTDPLHVLHVRFIFSLVDLISFKVV